MGVFLTDLADVLRSGGLKVVEADGWQRRGYQARYSTPDGGLLDVTGGLVHHTATPAKIKGDYPTYELILSGRPDVPGPLSQLGLGRSGTWYVFAAGRANHSGAVDDYRYANPRAIGVEAEHDGYGPWPVGQYLSYVTGCSVLSKHYGITWRGHKEAAVPTGRKVDPTFGMDAFRAEVSKGSALIRPTQPVEVDDMFTDDDRRRLHLLLHGVDQITLPALTRIDQRTAALLKVAGNAPVVDVDEEEVARLVLATLTPEAIAAAIPEGLAASVADRLEIRIKSGDAL